MTTKLVSTGVEFPDATTQTTSGVPLTGGTMTGDVSLGDNVKAKFGASDDLQIYHDGSNSWISELGTGDLIIAADNIRLRSTSGKNYLKGYTGGATELYHNNLLKIATTSTGIDVTGTVTADGLTVDGGVDGSTSYTRFAEHLSGYGFSGGYASYKGSSNELIFGRHNTFDSLTANDIPVMSIARATGDISFYEDTGTTPKFFWDASAESLGIGTTSPSATLQVGALTSGSTGNAVINHEGGSTPALQVKTRTNRSTLQISDNDTTGYLSAENGLFSIGRTAGLSANNINIDSSNKVGIGTTSPAYKLEVRDTTTSNYVSVVAADTGNAGITFGDAAAPLSGGILYNNSDSALRFFKSGFTEAMRIDSSGNVGIGTSSPSQLLSVAGNAMLQANQGYMYLSDVGTGNSGIYVRGTGTANELRSHSTGVHTWEVNGSEKMRIDSSGNLLHNLTSQPSPATVVDGTVILKDAYFAHARSSGTPVFIGRNGNDGIIVEFRREAIVKGTISISGSTTSYNTSSDYRLKENVLPMTGSIDRLKALKPSKFNFIAEPLKIVDGFLAHEAGEVVPECATGTKDAMMDEEYEVTPAVMDGETIVTEAVMGTRSVPDYQGIDQSKLVPLLVASLQEAIARIEVLENA